jgi:hypothetical protein
VSAITAHQTDWRSRSGRGARRVREQCAKLSSGVADPDAAAVRNFSYDGITITPADGAHINYGLRQTLCPQS